MRRQMFADLARLWHDLADGVQRLDWLNRTAVKQVDNWTNRTHERQQSRETVRRVANLGVLRHQQATARLDARPKLPREYISDRLLATSLWRIRTGGFASTVACLCISPPSITPKKINSHCLFSAGPFRYKTRSCGLENAGDHPIRQQCGRSATVRRKRYWITRERNCRHRRSVSMIGIWRRTRLQQFGERG